MKLLTNNELEEVVGGGAYSAGYAAGSWVRGQLSGLRQGLNDFGSWLESVAYG